MENLWTPNSWQSLRAEQQPDWGDEESYNNVIQEIEQIIDKNKPTWGDYGF